MLCDKVHLQKSVTQQDHCLVAAHSRFSDPEEIGPSLVLGASGLSEQALTRVEEQQDDDLERHQDQLQRLLWEVGLYGAGAQGIDPRQLPVLCGALIGLLLAPKPL